MSRAAINGRATQVRVPAARSPADYVPATRSLKRLRDAALYCHGCDLYKNATQTVFVEGNAHASIVFVGEEPGDSEDREGHPFVGPAGKLLRKALLAAGIAPEDVYLTNAVKHVKYLWRGKRRIHVKPKRIEVRACTPWLEAEIRLVRPRIVVALGATAAQALFGPGWLLTEHRGEFTATSLAPRARATVDPASILRAPDETRRIELTKFVADLKLIAKALHEEHASAPSVRTHGQSAAKRGRGSRSAESSER